MTHLQGEGRLRYGRAIVGFCLTRSRNHRILETALRPMTEASWS